MREALELSIDREALNQVAYDGQYTPGCTPISPNSVFFDKTPQVPDPRRGPGQEAAGRRRAGRRLHVRDGHHRTIRSSAGWARSSRAWRRRPGFNISLRPPEFASALKDNDDGKHQAFLIGWSGRVDPDGNIHQGQTCGGSLNATLACDEKVDALLNKAREVTDSKERRALYREAIDLIGAHRKILYLYHPNYIVAFPKNLKGYKAVPDGLIRIKGTSWQ